MPADIASPLGHRPPPRPPSSSLLTILAAIAAAARPALPTPAPTDIPPAFLCPALIGDDNLLDPAASSSSHHQHRIPSCTEPYPNAPAPTSVPNYQPNMEPNSYDGALKASDKVLPNKYEKGADGLWREVDVYTLYGSTICASCKGPTGVMMNDQIHPLQSTPNPPKPPAQPTVNFTDNLPPGWKPGTIVKRTSLILTVSLVLAAAICILIIGCLFFKRIRRKQLLKDVDLEMKLRKKKRRRSSSDGSVDVDKDPMVAREKIHKASQMLWARATARWKANARYTARQRRGKRGAIVRPSQSFNSSSVSFHRQEDTLELSSSTVPQRLQVACEQPTTKMEGQLLEDVPSPKSPGSTLPPAYHHSSTTSNLEIPIESGGSTMPSSLSPSSRYSLSSYRRLPHAAHVATDDKAVLAQMVGLVSAPSVVRDTAGVSAPAWLDSDEEEPHLTVTEDDPDHGKDESNPPMMPSFGSLSVLPPPPPKRKLSTTYFDYTLDDIANIEPEAGPSAPPFEETADFPPPIEMPSAPISFDPSQLEASAPSWDESAPDDACVSENEQYTSAHSSRSSLHAHQSVDSDKRPPDYRP